MSEYKNVEDPFIAAANRAIAPNVPEVVDQTAEVVEEVVTPIVEEVVNEEIKVTDDEVVNTESTETEVLKEEGTTLTEEVSTEKTVEADNFKNWDETITEEATENKPIEIDYSNLAKDLGFESTSRDEIIAEVKAIREEKAKSAELVAGLPDNLTKAIEIAQLDGDYLQYLGVTSVDYNKVDNMTLVQDQFTKHLTDANGTVDVEKLAEALEGLSDLDIEIRGKELKSQYIAQQEQFKQKVQGEAQAAKAKADIDLKDALGKIDDVRGLKLNGTHKKSLYDSISSGKMVQDLFYGSDGKMDYDKVVKVVFDAQYGDKVDKYLKQRITTTVKKDMLNKIGNKQVQTKTGGLAEPDKKPQNAQSELAEQLRKGDKVF